MYLLSFEPKAQGGLLEMISREALHVVTPIFSDIQRIRVLMDEYRDQPMDFADATLVTLAETTGLHVIFTLNRRDFGTYRLNGRRPITIVP